ncbi:MFS transporter [Paractinoplanes rishiriensis]|uniref:MFS transporter n=1 Tax=Paractinoplanes rishiriensis TaxID=1050105 RepID=A0A919K568_9ACTN|nr:MFS transporter [Actinoplanes rishiriensis]GIE99512.1 MFS transporter [Actinoplanes rishiriensis]
MTATSSEVRLSQLLRDRGYWRWSIATQLIRLPSFMAPIAYVLVSIELLGSPKTGGLLLAVMLVAVELSAPITGRIIDRLGVVKWAPRSLAFSAVARLLLAGLFFIKAPTAVLVAAVIVFSCIGSGAGGVVRVMLGRTVSDPMLPKALAVDSSVVELVIIVAPFAVAFAALFGGVGPLVAMALCTGVGALLFRQPGASRTVPPPEPEPAAAEAETTPEPAKPTGSLWRNPRYLFWLLVAIAFGHLLGTAEIGALPLARSLGLGNAMASAMIAALAAASATAGLLYAWKGNRIRASNTAQAVVLLTLMAGSVALIAFEFSLPLIFIGFFLLGAFTAPINTVRSHAAGHAIPAHRQVEGFAILDTANGLGFALAGLLLAVLPVSGMFAAGVVSTVVVLALTPLLVRRPAGR